jgi:hypothetical protein
MKQFQDEAATAAGTDRLLSDILNEKPVNETWADGLASLAVGLRLRGYLSDADRTCLESLAPCDRQAFLVYCGRVLHPSDGTPFPLQCIAIPAVPGGDALFSHHYDSDQGERGCAFKIQTAVINPDEPDRLLLGWFGSEPSPLEGCPDDQFSETVRRFRRAFAGAAEPVMRLRLLLEDAAPTLLLDRSTGLVLACNRAAADRAGRHDRALIGLPLARLRPLLNQPSSGHRLSMRHLSVAGLELTAITLAESTVAAGGRNSFSADFLLRPAQRRLAAIITAAERIYSQVGHVSDENMAGSARTIAHEARRLDELVGKQLALVGDTRLEVHRGDPAELINVAAERVESRLDHPCEIAIQDNRPDASTLIRHRSLDRLVEAVLEAHLAGADRPSHTQVTLEPSDTTPDLLIRCETAVSDCGISDRDLLLEYARRLAERLGYQSLSSRLTDGSQLCSEFSLAFKPSTANL